MILNKQMIRWFYLVKVGSEVGVVSKVIEAGNFLMVKLISVLLKQNIDHGRN
jgi:hypothetical protein